MGRRDILSSKREPELKDIAWVVLIIRFPLFIPDQASQLTRW